MIIYSLYIINKNHVVVVMKTFVILSENELCFTEQNESICLQALHWVITANLC